MLSMNSIVIDGRESDRAMLSRINSRQWFTIKQAARFLGCTEKSLSMRRKRSDGPACVRRSDGRIFYHRRALIGWMIARAA